MFGLRLSSERRRLGLSQQNVADLLGLSRSAVAMLETDRASLEVQRLLQLGQRGYDVLKVLTDDPGQVAAGRLLDWNLWSGLARLWSELALLLDWRLDSHKT